MLRRCAFQAWHFLWFWICSLIHSWLVCVVSISISCISDLILTCSRIQKKDISATFQIFSKKKKVPKNQHFFIYYPCFLDINTTHSTCNERIESTSFGCFCRFCVYGNISTKNFIFKMFMGKYPYQKQLSIKIYLAKQAFLLHYLEVLSYF